MDNNTRIYFRNIFREARAKAFQDAEGYQEILFALERFGAFLSDTIESLGKYEEEIVKFANESPLTQLEDSSYQVSFTTLYSTVTDGRNDALHQGAVARYLTSHAVQLALILEDALVSEATKVRDFMVRDVIQAYLWQPLSFIRQQMLTNSFSYIPILLPAEEEQEWHLIPDHTIASYLRSAPSKRARKTRLAKSLAKALESGELTFPKAEYCVATEEITQVLDK